MRQAGPQIILDGQSPDSKTMSDILQLVTMTLMSNLSYRGGGARRRRWAAAGGMGGAAAAWAAAAAAWAAAAAAAAWAADGRRHGMGGGGMGGMEAGAAARGLVIINRVTVPGPRQVLLHVKIAEINRTATRSIGVSWVYARGKSIIGSAAGQ